MSSAAVDAVSSFQAVPREERRETFVNIIRDVVANEGRDEAIRLLIENAFDGRTPQMERQAETLAAFARLPKDVALALLRPIDPATIREEDCLSDEEVERILAEAAD